MKTEQGVELTEGQILTVNILIYTLKEALVVDEIDYTIISRAKGGVFLYIEKNRFQYLILSNGNIKYSLIDTDY
jgi:hypothetical protein